ncbi:MAG: hypothetical protein WAW80_02750 [Candidatus Saccharimonadales bacterium]
MSEILDITPSLSYPDADNSALEYCEIVPVIEFNQIALALQDIDPNLQLYDDSHYQQELRISNINLEYLAIAKTLFVSKDYAGSRTVFNIIMDHVRPTGNIYLLDLLTKARDNLYR